MAGLCQLAQARWAVAKGLFHCSVNIQAQAGTTILCFTGPTGGQREAEHKLRSAMRLL